jgi:hypothetical protein
VGNLLGWPKGDGRSRRRSVREAHQSNAGGVTDEGASRQRGTKGEHDSYVAVEGADAGYVVRELKTATTVAAALVGGRG